MCALDQLTQAAFINTSSDGNDLAGLLIDELSNYPRTDGESQPNAIGAYLYTSNARNALKLAMLGLLQHCTAFVIAQNSLENALSLLID
jgi:hypothetical protein